ncbi:MAG: hypothetical protein HC809_12000 [Gammaproteobacteria bacterium]|nr:hypothetical protein [Gammaproteobacteria bacterium]
MASPASEKIILEVDQPASNHNGGMLAFGPDGYLYIALGDGGGANDQFGNGQNLGTLLGSVLRLDVHPPDPADAYRIPADNPFVGRAGARGEIWAFGLRNPYRFSFDRQNGDLWLGDVGQGAREEVDLVTRGGNYGWNAFEGNLSFSSTPLASGTTHSPPVRDYPRSQGTTVIGGYVYRGSRFASLFGRYLFADYGAGTVWALTWNGTQVTATTVLDTASNPTSFGESNDGEVFVVQQNGTILEFAESGGGGSIPTTLSATGLFSDVRNLTPASGLIEYGLNHGFWSDGAEKRRWLMIPSNQRITFSATGAWLLPVGSVLVKHFEMEMIQGNASSARRLETRVLVRGTNEWFGFVYRWNVQETEANLIAGRESEILTIQVPGDTAFQQQYDYPSRTDCLQCHTPADWHDHAPALGRQRIRVDPQGSERRVAPGATARRHHHPPRHRRRLTHPASAPTRSSSTRPASASPALRPTTPSSQSRCGGVFLRTLLRFVERRSAGKRAKSGAVNFVQRFGSALNLNCRARYPA